MRFVLATANAGKAREIAEVLGATGLAIELVPRPVGVPDVEETGTTLEDNARLKAVGLCEATGLPAIADDTGLVVDALGGAPGVRSARFAGDDATDARNVAKLLELLRDVDASAAPRASPPSRSRGSPTAVRSPHLVGRGDHRERAQGRGRIRLRPRVRSGRRRWSDVRRASGTDKNSLSHRGRAFRTLADGLRVVERMGE